MHGLAVTMVYGCVHVSVETEATIVQRSLLRYYRKPEAGHAWHGCDCGCVHVSVETEEL